MNGLIFAHIAIFDIKVELVPKPNSGLKSRFVVTLYPIFSKRKISDIFFATISISLSLIARPSLSVATILREGNSYSAVNQIPPGLLACQRRSLLLFSTMLSDWPFLSGNANDNAPSITRYSPVIRSFPFDDQVCKSEFNCYVSF